MPGCTTTGTAAATGSIGAGATGAGSTTGMGAVAALMLVTSGASP